MLDRRLLAHAGGALDDDDARPRLGEKARHGIVERRFYEQHPPRAEYLLTEKGNELRPVLRALLDWGRTHTKFGR